MKSLKRLFRGVKAKIEPEQIENYYGHGAIHNSSDVHSHNSETEHEQVKKFICPMKCEGSKTYDEPGNCPICNMKLVHVNVDQTGTG